MYFLLNGSGNCIHLVWLHLYLCLFQLITFIPPVTCFTINANIFCFTFLSKLSTINSTGITSNVSSLPMKPLTFIFLNCAMSAQLKSDTEFTYNLVLPSSSNASTTSLFLSLLITQYDWNCSQCYLLIII